MKKNQKTLLYSENKYDNISPFELKNKLIEQAKETIKRQTSVMLNAGRGNPNWIATRARDAFFTLGRFGMEECRLTLNLDEGFAGSPQKDGISSRFTKFLDKNKKLPGISLLKDFFSYMLLKHYSNPDELIYEWVESIIGNQYPMPDRILKHSEIIIKDFLNMEMCNGNPPKEEYDLFATEGSTAGMCYVFDSLQQNFLLNKGDSIALLVPAFTPYIEIPKLDRYKFDVLEICANRLNEDELHTWQYNPKDFDALKDKKYKALFVINPSNPPSYSLDAKVISKIKEIIRFSNPNLMIITDDVYGTYVKNFRSLIAELPYNTMCLYSFSKYFGATGWRIAIISLYRKNIFDYLIAGLPDDKKELLNKRYNIITDNVTKLKFIDRMVADSRQIALNHTAGLSLPQQMQMSLFAASSILDKNNIYKNKMQEIIDSRLNALWNNCGFKLEEDPHRAGYYSEIDLIIWAKKFYGADFVNYLQLAYTPIDIVFRLAQETGIVVLNGKGFDGPQWSIRVSLANLNIKDYIIIGKAIRKILTEYAEEWKSSI